MIHIQPKKDAAMFERIDRYRISNGLTWKQVSQRLGISVPMLMHVKSGARRLSPKAQYRFEQVERTGGTIAEAAAATARSITHCGGHQFTLKLLCVGYLDLDAEYQDGVQSGAFPKTIRLTRPSADQCDALTKLVAQTFEVRLVLLACLPAEHGDEDFLDRLTLRCLSRFQAAALTLVYGVRWRSVVAGLAVGRRMRPA